MFAPSPVITGQIYCGVPLTYPAIGKSHAPAEEVGNKLFRLTTFIIIAMINHEFLTQIKYKSEFL